MKIRLSRFEDIPALKLILDQTDLFPSDMLAEMIGGFLSEDKSDDIWLTCEMDNEAVGFCYAIPEQLTDGTWNLLAIAVNPSKQSGGVGRALVRQLEDTLRDRGNRLLIVDTSGADEFSGTRLFYEKNDYTEEARIRDFWMAGDDKVIFRKTL